jgi:putative flippase GtrA
VRTGLISWLKFNAVGLIGVGVQLLVLTLLKTGLGMNVLVATVLAVECAVIHNFIWHERWTWAHRRLDVRKAFGRLLRFNASNGLISMGGNLAMMWLLVTKLHLNFIFANLCAIGACSLLNFFVSDRLIFRTRTIPS